MGRTALLVVGWIIALVAHYIILVALEFHWNLFCWFPHLDLQSCSLAVALLGVLAGTWHLARLPQNRFARIFSLAGCLALAGLGVYVLPAEPKSEGLFSRQLPSPLWYRGGRFVAMTCPGLFWAAGFLRWRRAALVSDGGRYLASP
jgi:hypothetical protein